MTLVARTSDANIISAVNSIDELAEACDLFWEDKHRTASVWLEENATAETTKRSLIQSIELIPLQVGNFTPLLGKTGMQYTLTIVHSSAWENATEASVIDASVSALGGLVVLPAIDGICLRAYLNYYYLGKRINRNDNQNMGWYSCHARRRYRFYACF